MAPLPYHGDSWQRRVEGSKFRVLVVPQAPGPAKQRMPWETEPGVAKANAQTAKAEPARQRMPWETESLKRKQ